MRFGSSAESTVRAPLRGAPSNRVPSAAFVSSWQRFFVVSWFRGFRDLTMSVDLRC